MEEYMIRFMQLVKYVPYMNTNERQVECFVCGMNCKIRVLVHMMNMTLVAKVVSMHAILKNLLIPKGIREGYQIGVSSKIKI